MLTCDGVLERCNGKFKKNHAQVRYGKGPVLKIEQNL